MGEYIALVKVNTVPRDCATGANRRWGVMVALLITFPIDYFFVLGVRY